MRSPTLHPISEPLEPRRLLTTWYVDARSAAPAPDGSSWSTAYPDLQLALSAATAGDTINVAQGTYKPTATTDRTLSFQLKSGVSLYGGYAGSSSPTPDTRDPSLYPTTLSGDIGTTDDNSDNTNHILVASSPSPGTTLDGLTLTAGNNASYSYTLPDSGGAIYCSGGTLTINNCNFNANAAIGGGAIHFDSATASVMDCAFTSNLSYSGNAAGGAIEATRSTLSFTGCTFTSNIGGTGGGAINCSSPNFIGSLTVTQCTFSSNSGGAGGAIDSDATLSLTSSTFTGNTSRQGGGALYLTDPGGTTYTPKTISASTFTGNTASYGGAIGAYISGTLNVTGCTFTANSASFRGGAASVSVGTPATATFADCLFVDNAVTGTSGVGGALYIAPYLASTGTHPTVGCVNSTFVANRAANGGGVAVFDVAVASLANCVLYADSSPEFYFGASYTGGPVGTATVTYSDIQDGYPGTGNLSANPLFYRNPSPGPDSTWGTPDDDYGDLRLLPNSPCLDAGSNAALPAGTTTDLAGHPRITDFPGAGPADAAVVDMGVYESSTDLGDLHITPGQTVTLPAGGYAFTATQLIVDPGGTLDLADDSLLITYAGPSPLPAVRSALASGYHNGTWTGAGITSSAARANPHHAVGYAEATSLGLTTFAGRPVDGPALLLKYTLAGDATFDGRLNADDFALADRGRARGTFDNWVHGDFNYDAAVTDADLAILDAAFAPAPPAPAPVAATVAASDDEPAVVPITAALLSAENPAPAPAAQQPATPAIPPHRAKHKPKAKHAKHHLAKAKQPKHPHLVQSKHQKAKSPPHAAIHKHPSRAIHSSHPHSAR